MFLSKSARTIFNCIRFKFNAFFGISSFNIVNNISSDVYIILNCYIYINIVSMKIPYRAIELIFLKKIFFVTR